MTSLLLSQAGPLFAAGGVMVLFWVIALLLSIFWLWMLIDCLTSALPTAEKVLWFLVIFFLHIIGAVIYYFVARSHGTRGGTHTGGLAT